MHVFIYCVKYSFSPYKRPYDRDRRQLPDHSPRVRRLSYIGIEPWNGYGNRQHRLWAFRRIVSKLSIFIANCPFKYLRLYFDTIFQYRDSTL
jgi:hypothetical protein